jgi:hypothetical protein
LAVGDRNIAEALNFGAWEFQANQLSTFGMKVRGGLQHILLILPLLFPRTNDNRVWWDQGFEGFCVVGKPGPPNRFARLEEFRSILRRCCQTRYDEYCQRTTNS